MNVYLIQEDGVSFCIRAETMQEAIKICEIEFVTESMAEEEISGPVAEKEATIFYHSNILQSCALVAEIRN